MRAFVAVVLLLSFTRHAQAVDIVLKNGTIYTGTNVAPFVGDLAIDGDRILTVGKFSGAANWELDCTGLVIAPGFIDLHNHSDRQVTKRATRAVANYLMQGCTTIVTGNCAAGPVFAGAYYRKIDAAGVGTNVAHLIPQGDLRERVLGNSRRKPTTDELEEMKELTKKAMLEGAWGMTTGLIYVPSSYADTAEIVKLARVVGEHGGIYASHIRGEGSSLLKSLEEAAQIGKEAKLPVHISHLKCSGRSNWGLSRQAVRLIEKHRAAGLTMTADQYPYIASSTSMNASLLSTWVREGGRDKLLERLDKKDTGSRIRKDIARRLKQRDDGRAIRIARYKKRSDWTGLSVAQIAEKTGDSQLDIVLQIIRGGGASVVNFSMSEDDVRYFMTRDWVATASDGKAYLPGFDKPHPRSYGTFPRKLGHYAAAEKVIPLQHAIRSATSLPAEILGLPKRGRLERGYFADVVVFDVKTLRDTATFTKPHQLAEGVRHVFVNGGPSVVNGRLTGACHGKALRKTNTSADASR